MQVVIEVSRIDGFATLCAAIDAVGVEARNLTWIRPATAVVRGHLPCNRQQQNPFIFGLRDRCVGEGQGSADCPLCSALFWQEVLRYLDYPRSKSAAELLERTTHGWLSFAAPALNHAPLQVYIAPPSVSEDSAATLCLITSQFRCRRHMQNWIWSPHWVTWWMLSESQVWCLEGRGSVVA